MFLLGFIILVFCMECAISEEQIPNSSCERDGECLVKYTNAKCNLLKCECNTGYGPVPSNNSYICDKLAVKINDPCSIDGQCQSNLGMDSICDKNGTCQCRGQYDQFNEDNRYCYHLNALKYSCRSSDDCSFNECNHNLCKCKKDEILRVGQTTQSNCYSVKHNLDSDCEKDEQCQFGKLGPSSLCDAKRCKCIEEKSKFNKTSEVCELFKHNLDSDCEKDEQCQFGKLGPSSLCVAKRCKCIEEKSKFNKTSEVCELLKRCLNDSILYENMCYNKAALNESCEVNEQCSALTNNSICDQLICKCDYNNNYTTVNDTCYKVPACLNDSILYENICYNKTALSGSCKINEQCSALTNNSICDKLICKCDYNNNYSIVNDTCYKDIGEPCTKDSICQYNRCSDGKCKCPDSMFEIGKDCFVGRYLNETCHHTAQCLNTTTNSQCEEWCRCDNNYTVYGTVCYPTKNGLGSECKVDNQCTAPYAKCINDSCSCSLEYQRCEEKCYLLSDYNTRCKEDGNHTSWIIGTICGVLLLVFTIPFIVGIIYRKIKISSASYHTTPKNNATENPDASGDDI